METYSEFLNRINSFEKKKIDFGGNHFSANPKLLQKVDENNGFKKFYGDTVVFDLDKVAKKTLAEYVDVLYKSVPQCFCERLRSDFHVTLHDLSSSPDLRSVAEEAFRNEIAIIEKAVEIRRHVKVKIKMKSKCVFNMVDTSLVLGMYPADEEAYCGLMELYSVFEGIKKLEYPFTPHVTLAYFNINGFDVQSGKILEDTVNKLNNNEIELELSVSKLHYQKFVSMNEFFNVINLVNFN